VKEHAGAYVYRVGVALLDRCAPHKVLGATPGFIFQAEAPYETSGLVPNVVFPTGLLRRGGELWLYYGGADSCVCLARANLDDVMATLRPHERTRGRFSRHQAQCAWDGD
jgi:predicted GH43/DUF377 family glycosyl hydrolase